MTEKRAVILLAHGSPAPAWRKPIEAIAARASELSEHPVALAWLGHAPPDLATCIDELAAQDISEIAVAPLFFASGGHVTRDVPAIIAAALARHPTVAITVGPAVGERADVVDAIARSVSAQ